MRSPSESLDLITSYLNDPSDRALEAQIAAFRSASAENDIFFIEIEQIWARSAAAGRLEGVDVSAAVQQFKEKIAPVPVVKSTAWTWFKGIAASILLAAFGFWLYTQNAEIELFVKSTGSNQIDSVKLSDGSVIVLAANSTLKYPEKFGPEKREIFLSKGEAFFKIAKDPIHPFRVILNKSAVEVLGTSFNIRLSTAAIELGVKTGRVVFTTYKDGATSVLTAGQALSYNISKNELLTKTAQNADSWLTKELVFVDTPLEEVCKQLTNYYGVQISLENTKHQAKKLNARFTDQQLADVLLVLNETYNIKIKKDHNQIYLITP